MSQMPPMQRPQKSHSTAVLLAMFFGQMGIDRFYLGYTGIGLAKLFTCGGCGIWSLIDLYQIATHKVQAADGSTLAP
jgi:TM2 domain-containing membrane protein YozV